MRDKSVATAAAAVLAAFAVAHLMQFGLTAGRALSGDARPAPVGLATYLAAGPESAARVPPTPAAPTDPVVPPIPGALVRLDQRVPGGLPTSVSVSAGRVDGLRLACNRVLLADPAPGAMLRLRLDAPCDPGVRVEIRHAGLRFTVSTGPRGTREIVMPALVSAAQVTAVFADGTVAGARAVVPEAAEVERVAVVLDGGLGVALQAGAGEVHRLGDAAVAAPILAEVHSLVPGRFGPLPWGTPRLEVEVTTSNCARDVVAEILRMDPEGAPERLILRVAMPECNAVGNVVALDLPAPTLRVAGK
jgi:hypothetical protein